MAKYESRARSEGFGGRATQNSYTQQPRRSTYDGPLKASSFKESSPFTTGYGFGRHKQPEDANKLYVDGDHRKDVKAMPHNENPRSKKPPAHDAHLEESAKGCWAEGWRECVTEGPRRVPGRRAW